MTLTTLPLQSAPPTSAPARVDSPEPDGLDRSLSSTTPDVPRTRPMLSIPGALGVGLAAGAGIGLLLLRGRGAGWGFSALGTGAWKGAAVGAGMGAALIGVDRATGGQVKKQLDYVSLDRRAQILFVLRNPTRPWLAGMGISVAADARAAQEALYGQREPLDGPQDAFRHTFAAALFSLRATRDHGQSPDDAHRLAIDAGEAHEVDGQDNNDDFSRAMDSFNNRVGTEIAGDGRAASGESADADGYLTEHALRDRVLRAIADGRVQLVDRSTETPVTRSSGDADLPPRN
jgi:hypothetical protein